MNSALAKLQCLSNQSDLYLLVTMVTLHIKIQTGSDSATWLRQSQNHNLPFWPTEAYQAHRSPLAYCHWAACTIMPIGQEGHCAKNISWHILGAKDFWYWSHFIPLPLTQPLCHLPPPTPWVLILIHTPLLSVKNLHTLHILHPKTQNSFNPSRGKQTQ